MFLIDGESLFSHERVLGLSAQIKAFIYEGVCLASDPLCGGASLRTWLLIILISITYIGRISKAMMDAMVDGEDAGGDLTVYMRANCQG